MERHDELRERLPIFQPIQVCGGRVLVAGLNALKENCG
jgi:hypothetical protein